MDTIVPFLAAAVLLTVSPGPDQVYIISRTLAQGRMVGFVSSWGVCSGAAIHILAAAFGFTLIIQTSALAYALLKYVGAAYLVWLAIQAFRQKAVPAEALLSSGSPGWAGASLVRVYLQGVMIDICNPKVALFFLAFLPQFIPVDAVNPTGSFLMLGGCTVVIGLVWEAGLIVCSDMFLGRFLKNSRFVRYLNRAMGAVFIALAANVVLADDPR